ncbi:hypothetical protein ACQJBY_059424 [Aegilops geniculata]
MDKAKGATDADARGRERQPVPRGRRRGELLGHRIERRRGGGHSTTAVLGAPTSGGERRQEATGEALRRRPPLAALSASPPLPASPAPLKNDPARLVDLRLRASSTFLTSRSAAAADPRGGVERSWIHVKASTASVQTLEVDNATMMYSCELATRVLSLFVTLLVSPQRSSAGSASLSSTPS